MTDIDGSGSEPDVVAASAAELLRVADAVLEGWVVRSVRQRWADYRAAVTAGSVVVEAGSVASAAVAAGDHALDVAAAQAAAEARRDVLPALRGLLERDVEAQWTGPLAILRRTVAYPTAVLRSAGVPPVVRDGFAERNFPDDEYDLTPGSFADIHPDLHEPGLRWGAAKAHTVLRRRKGRA